LWEKLNSNSKADGLPDMQGGDEGASA